MRISNPVLVFLTSLLLGCNTLGGSSFTGFSSQDEQIYQQVKDKLSRTYDRELENLDVGVANGVVSVTGFVRKIRQSDNAQFLISQVPGVKDIENNIVVKPE